MMASAPKCRQVSMLHRGMMVMFVVALIGTITYGSVRLTRHRVVAPTPRCPLNAQLVPRCGALVGITPPAPNVGSLDAVERALGHRFDLVYTFHDVDSPVPSAYDRAVLGRGDQLHVTIDPRDYATQAAPMVGWRAIADGAYDTALARQARGIASIGRPVFVTFDHEPDQPTKSILGGPADFVAAWRHVHQLFAANGAKNAVWVWVVTGWQGSFVTALSMWPGNNQVDWISWEAYNQAGCQEGTVDAAQQRTFSEAALPFLNYLIKNGPAAGIDVTKPMMISEAGTVGHDGRPDTQWFADIPSFLKDHPQIKAVTLWDHTGSTATCDFTFTDRGPTRKAAARALRAQWLNPLLP